LGAEGQKKYLSKGDVLYVERKRMYFTYCIKTFHDGEGGGTIFFSRKWFIINDEGAYKRMIECTKVVELRNIEEYLKKLDVNERTKVASYKWEYGREG
jgi:hypothetical protein